MPLRHKVAAARPIFDCNRLKKVGVTEGNPRGTGGTAPENPAATVTRINRHGMR
mgnify:CR=1 FL=1